MRHEFQMEHNFEELTIPGYGDSVLLYGTATLADAGDGYFYVKDIVIGDKRITPMREPSSFRGHLANQIRDALYASAYVAQKWAEARDEYLWSLREAAE